MVEARQMLRKMDELTHQTRRTALGWQSSLKLTLDDVVRVDKLPKLIEDFYQEFEFAELQINMEVYNGSWGSDFPATCGYCYRSDNRYSGKR